MRPQETAASKILEAMKAYKPGENFTSNDISEMSEVRKGRVQMYISTYAKQGKIVLVNKSQYPYVYRWPSTGEASIANTMKKHAKISNQQRCEAIEDSKRDYESELKYRIQEEPNDSYDNVSPLQIGLGIIGLIQSLKNGGDHDVKTLKLRIKELEGTLNFKDRELNEKKNQIVQYQSILKRKDKQIELLSSHLGVLSKGSGISIKDILDKV